MSATDGVLLVEACAARVHRLPAGVRSAVGVAFPFGLSLTLAAISSEPVITAKTFGDLRRQVGASNLASRPAEGYWSGPWVLPGALPCVVADSLPAPAGLRLLRPDVRDVARDLAFARPPGLALLRLWTRTAGANCSMGQLASSLRDGEGRLATLLDLLRGGRRSCPGGGRCELRCGGPPEAPSPAGCCTLPL